jgi:hypothetical protein
MDDRKRATTDAMKCLHAARKERARRLAAGETLEQPKLSSPEAYFKALPKRRPGDPVRFR